jgi:hypothetical protein
MTFSKIRIKALMSFLFSCLTSLVILESCSSEKKEKEKENLESKINIEDSIDICLTRYDFESARNYLSLSEVNDKEKKLLTIVKAEIAFYLREGEIEKAFQDIDETDFGYKEWEGKKLKFKLYEDVVEVLLDKNDLDGAKKYAQKSPEDIWSEGGEYGVTTNPASSIRYKLLKRIKEFKKN